MKYLGDNSKTISEQYWARALKQVFAKSGQLSAITNNVKRYGRDPMKKVVQDLF